jgi:hypothetical protein
MLFDMVRLGSVTTFWGCAEFLDVIMGLYWICGTAGSLVRRMCDRIWIGRRASDKATTKAARACRAADRVGG